MRKTCLYWSTKETTLLEDQLRRLKTLCALYPELIISETVPSKFSPRQDYIRLTSSEAQPTIHLDLVSTIVYCLKLNSAKKQQIEWKYNQQYKVHNLSSIPKLLITNNFNEVIRYVVKQLGYEQSITNNNSKSLVPAESTKKEASRFQIDKQRQNDVKNTAEMILREEFLNLNNVRQASKAFKLNIEQIQKQDIKVLIKILENQLRQYLKSKQIQPLDKEFQKIRQSKTLTELCRACLHFYTLQKHFMYHNLNFLLRNIRSVIFREQLEKLKLFAFLLLLNYLYAYSYDTVFNEAPTILYRYTDANVEPELMGQIVTVPSFYSVTTNENIEEFKKKQTKLIIHPLVEGNSSISLTSLFPIHYFSAFKKEQQYLYIPFTCFLITQVRYRKSQEKWIVVMKQVPGNPLIKRVFDLNLLNNKNLPNKMIPSKIGVDNQGSFTADWELNCQQRYEYSSDNILKIKTSMNLGLIFLRLMEKFQMAINYFIQGIDTALKFSKNNSPNLTLLILKGYNYLGLAYIKNLQQAKADQAFKKAEKYMKQLEDQSKNSKINSKNSINYLVAALKNNQALLFECRDQYKQAISKYKEALGQLQKSQVKNQLMEACIMSNIGACLAKIKAEQNQIFTYLRDSFVKYLQVYGITTTVINVESPTKQKVSAQKQLQNLFEYVSENNILISQLISLFENCSQVYQILDKTQPSISSQQSAIKLYQKLNLIQQNQSSTLMYMKSRLAGLLMRAQRYKESIEIYEKLLPIARLVDDTGKKSAIFKSNIASAHVNMGSDDDLKRAVWWYTESIHDISSPLLSENLEFYNKICDLRKEIEDYLNILN